MVTIDEAKGKFSKVNTHGLGLKGGSKHQGFFLNVVAEKIDEKHLVKHFSKFHKEIKEVINLIKKSRYQEVRTKENEMIDDLAKIMHYQYEFSFHITLLMERELENMIEYLQRKNVHSQEILKFIAHLSHEIKSDLKNEIQLINANVSAANSNTTLKGSVSSRLPMRASPLVVYTQGFMDRIGIKRAERLEVVAEKLSKKKEISSKLDMTILKDYLNSFDKAYQVFKRTLILLRIVLNEINSEEDILKQNLTAELLKKYIPDRDARTYLEINKLAKQKFIEIMHREMISVNQIANLFKKLFNTAKQQKAKPKKLAA